MLETARLLQPLVVALLFLSVEPAYAVEVAPETLLNVIPRSLIAHDGFVYTSDSTGFVVTRALGPDGIGPVTSILRPEAPTPQYLKSGKLAASGRTLAHVLRTDTVRFLGLSDPARPRAGGQLRIEGVTDVSDAGSAFVIFTGRGRHIECVQVVDASDVSRPHAGDKLCLPDVDLVRSTLLSGTSHSNVDGGRIVVGRWFSKEMPPPASSVSIVRVDVVDLRDPAAPRLEGSWQKQTERFAWVQGMALQGSRLFMSLYHPLDEGSSLEIIDLSSPAAPVPVASQDLGKRFLAFQRTPLGTLGLTTAKSDGEYRYGLLLLDLSARDRVTIAGDLSQSVTQPEMFDTDGSKLVYSDDRTGDLKSATLIPPGAARADAVTVPAVLAGWESRDLLVHEGLIYSCESFSDRTFRLNVARKEASGALTLVHSSDFTGERAGRDMKLFVHGDMLYAVYQPRYLDNTLEIAWFSLAAPEAPLLVGRQTLADVRSWAVAHKDGFLLTGGGEKPVQVFDLRVPLRAALVAEIPVASWTRIAVVEDRLYVGTQLGFFKLIDLKDPAHPGPVQDTSILGVAVLGKGPLTYVFRRMSHDYYEVSAYGNERASGEPLGKINYLSRLGDEPFLVGDRIAVHDFSSLELIDFSKPRAPRSATAEIYWNNRRGKVVSTGAGDEALIDASGLYVIHLPR